MLSVLSISPLPYSPQTEVICEKKKVGFSKILLKVEMRLLSFKYVLGGVQGEGDLFGANGTSVARIKSK